MDVAADVLDDDDDVQFKFNSEKLPASSVTRQKSPNVYKSCPTMNSLEK